MARRIWVAEGFSSDGHIYGRALQLPTGDVRNRFASLSSGSDVQRMQAVVLKTHLGDIPSCPCLDVPSPQGHDDE
ncbi:hypothetical protein XthCFBP4691_18600 [Xanthomonas theicola]|uniref:Uncharacterized protein n=1 Tax=Xanthomonas theicola TaxID=56464 RepID=A0A2S6ZAL8_9XANT|nr:hypothetical protein XthCFBP4691_18600 [Xanthomonas theicola]